MKTNMKKIAICFTISTVLNFGVALCNANAQATGSHGGDARCQEFYAMASEVSIDLAKIGQPEINKVNSLINVAVIRSQVMKPLEVLPAHNLDRQALSNPSTDVTQLDVEAWMQLSQNEKIKLVTHELMVLSMAESDGEYLVSQDALNLLQTAGFLARPVVTQTKMFTKQGNWKSTVGDYGASSKGCKTEIIENELKNECKGEGFAECSVTQSAYVTTKHRGADYWSNGGSSGTCMVAVKGTK